MIRKNEAIALRRKGRSIREIASELSAAKSSVSTWVRGIVLTDEQQAALKANTHSQATIEKRRQSRLKTEVAKRK